jgi:hypothetical protein
MGIRWKALSKTFVQSLTSVHSSLPVYRCSPPLWSLVFGLCLWSLSLVFVWVLGLWSLVFGLCLWSLFFGLWSLVFGLWSLVFVFGFCSLVFGLWSLVFGLWSLVFGLGLWSLVLVLVASSCVPCLACLLCLFSKKQGATSVPKNKEQHRFQKQGATSVPDTTLAPGGFPKRYCGYIRLLF